MDGAVDLIGDYLVNISFKYLLNFRCTIDHSLLLLFYCCPTLSKQCAIKGGAKGELLVGLTACNFIALFVIGTRTEMYSTSSWEEGVVW